MTETAAPNKVVVITTGGTIACTADRNGILLPTVSGEQLVAPVAARFAPGTMDIEVRELTRLDSSSMTFADIDEIVQAVHDVLEDPTVSGVVVTHGTDSMEETAVAVDTFHNDPRPVVFTGSQKPFDHPESDGPNNLFESIVIASDDSAHGIGCLIVFGHAVLPARGATKWHTTEELAFATNGPEEPTRPVPVDLAELAGLDVRIVHAYPGAGRDILDYLKDKKVDGIVVESMGSGNVSTEFAHGLIDVLEAGIPVALSTRVPRGEVLPSYGGVGGGASLHAKGAFPTTYFRSAQARVLLAISIATGRHLATLM
ncbi:L-asparaginase precursor [Corynebacterium kalinowskii]|uniref:asparaginase n=1 Tax=Corynebacterium kalinowskii TaxID=2675216 RepID=A0A6B8VDX4_9CORY|nr:asparaginase [Corynebacterium kalinowskii]QGU02373.1 L-asparaginase precursor [Corynebacterium kalinowskii]